MSLIFKKAARENLSNVSVYIDDTTNTSPKYFRVSDVPQVLQKGKNLLRISAHPTNLVEGSQILVDVRDSNGNPIYFEIPDYLEADKSRVISIWIYNDKGDDNTANGDAVITLVGISKVGNNGEPIPERFRGKPNVRWQTTVNVDRDRKNTSSVIFKSNTLPSVAISESIEAYQNQPQSGDGLLLQSQTGNGARYLFRGTTSIIQLTDGSQFNEEMLGYSFVLSNYETPAEPISKYPNPNSDTFYSSSISQVLDATTAVLRTPYTTSFADREELVHTYNNIESANYSIQYFQTGSNIVTENQRSFANLTLTNVNPIAGVVDKVKVLIKSDGLPGEYELLNEVTVPYSSSFSVKVPIPSENLQDPKLLKIQYLNSIGEISRTETITSPFVFQGGNFYFGGGDNLITGSIFISNAIGSGIEVGGASSGFIRSVGFEGQTSASLGKGPGGFIIYSGSNALKIGEDYLQGVGMQMIGDNDDRHFIFTTHDGGLLDVKTDKFFIGTTDSQFISGSDGNIEISSSLFHLDPVNDLLVIGADAVINADLSVNNLRTPAIINGSPSTRTNSSSSIDSDGFARFVSASIGGFEVSETQINSTNDNLILKDSGQITGSNVLFSGGEIAGFEISNSQINSSNNNLILKASGQITASDGFLFGDKNSSQYVQFDDGNLVVRGDLSVDQIFTPATINGSPANINNASSSITSDGFAKFVSASIGGWDITTGSIEGGNLIMKPEGILQTRDFASGLKGWKISSEGNGTAEFENVRIRGTMRTTTFEKESVNAVGGQLWVANSTTITGSIIANDATMSVKNAKGFESGEILIAKKVDGTGFQTEYILVNSSSVDGNQSNEDENYGRIYVTRGYGSGSSGDFVGDIASISQSYEDGQVVVSTGKVGTGYIKLNANPSDTATPFMDVVERTGSGLYDVTLAARLGDLSGLAGSDYVFGSSTPGYGLATNNVFLQGGIKATFGEIGGFGINETTISSSNSLLILSSSGQIFAESGRIASFIISSSKFDALRLVEEFTPISERSGSINVNTIPIDVDGRATISITGVTSSNIGIESITINASDTDITLDSLNVFTENSDFEIFYTESLQYNSTANQSVAVTAKFQSSSISVLYPTASIAAYSSSIVNGEFAFGGGLQNFDVSSYFLSTVEGVDALAFELPTNPASNINPTSDGFYTRLFTDVFGVPLDDRVGFYPNGLDLDGFVDINIDDISPLTGSSSVTTVSSSDVKDSISTWSPAIDASQFTLFTEYILFVPQAGFASNTNSSSPETDFINAYWTASDGTYSPDPQYIWVSSGSVDLSELDGSGGGTGYHTFFLTASNSNVEATPDTFLVTPTKSATVYSGNEITVSQFNTITGSSFMYIQQIAELGGVSPSEWSEILTRGLVESFGEGLEYSGSAELLGITSEQIVSGILDVTPQNYSNNEAGLYAALLKPGWFVNPDVISILNGIDTTTGSLAGWFEIETSGSLTTWNTSPGSEDIPSWQGGSRGLPLKLRHNLAITETTSSSELEIKNGIWPLDIVESGSIEVGTPTFNLNQDLGLVVDRGGDPINVTQRLDNIRVQTDLTAAELAAIYPDSSTFNSTAFKKFAVDYESTNTYNSTTEGGKISMGYQSGSFVEKVTFSISGSGQISSSKFFIDEQGNITGSQVNFSGGTISGSDLNINANQFDFGAAGGFISGSNGSLIISSSLFSLTDTTLEVKGDIRASSGFIQDTYLGGKIVELGVQNPDVPTIRYELPFIETYSTSSTDVRLTSLTGSSKTSFQGSHGKWSLSSIFQSTPQMLVTGSTLDGVGYPVEFKSWYDISGVSKDYKFINDFTQQDVANASSSLSPSLIGNQLVFNKENTFRTGSNVYKTLTSEFIHISESFAGSEYKNAHLQFALRGTTHPHSGGFTGFFPQYKIDIISGSTTYYTKVYKDENATEKSWTVFDIPISDILEIEATSNSNKSIENAFKVRIGMLYSGSSATGTVGSGVEGLGWALTEMRMVEPARVAAIDTQTLHFKDTYLTWDGKEVTAHKGHFAPIITSSLFESVSGSRYTLGRPKQRWQTAYLKNSVDTLSDRNLKKNIEISPLGLGFIESLKPVKYDFKDDNTTHYGLIAQEVSQSLAEFDVHIDDFGGYNGNEGYLSLKYEEFISPMIKAIQDQQQIIKDLQSRIETLESGSTN